MVRFFFLSFSISSTSFTTSSFSSPTSCVHLQSLVSWCPDYLLWPSLLLPEESTLRRSIALLISLVTCSSRFSLSCPLLYLIWCPNARYTLAIFISGEVFESSSPLSLLSVRRHFDSNPIFVGACISNFSILHMVRIFFHLQFQIEKKIRLLTLLPPCDLRQRHKPCQSHKL